MPCRKTHRLSKSQKSPKDNRKSQSLNAFREQPLSSVSVQAPSLRSHSHVDSVYQCINNPEHSQVYTSVVSNHGNFTNEQYTACVIAGAASLGINVSTDLQLLLVDQHESLGTRKWICSAVARRVQILEDPPGVQISGFDQSSLRDSSVVFGYGGDRLNEDLAGIGAQFDC